MRFKNCAMSSTEGTISRIKPENSKIKTCSINLKRQSSDELSSVCYQRISSLSKDHRILSKTPDEPMIKQAILKPFNTVFTMGNISFRAKSTFSKHSKGKAEVKDILTSSPMTLRRSYRTQEINRDIYEFIPEPEKDNDPTVDVVQKLIKEGKARVIKKKFKNSKITSNSTAKIKPTSTLLRNLKSALRTNYKKFVKGKESRRYNARPKFTLSTYLFESSAFFNDYSNNDAGKDIYQDDSKSLIVESKQSVLEKGIEFRDSSKNGRRSIPLESPVKNYETEAEISHKKATINEQVSNFDEVLTNPSEDRADEASNLPGIGENEISRGRATPWNGRDLNFECIDEEQLSTNMDLSINTENFEKRKKQLPNRKAFWEVDDLVENVAIDKPLVRRTYGQLKEKQHRTPFFLLFSDDHCSENVECFKENKSSPYNTRSSNLKLSQDLNKQKMTTINNEPILQCPTTAKKRSCLKREKKVGQNQYSGTKNIAKKMYQVRLKEVESKHANQLASIRL